jgi:hypothetical protein
VSRPLGVTLISILLLGFSFYMVYGVLSHPAGGRRGRSLLVAAVLAAALAVLATEALWNLRSHAFLTFMIWAAAAMTALVLTRLHSPAGAHAVRLVPSIVYAGIGIAAAALYLRRAT